MDLFFSISIYFLMLRRQSNCHIKRRLINMGWSSLVHWVQFLFVALSGTVAGMNFCQNILKHQSFDNFFCIRSWLTTGKPFTQKRRVFLTLRYSPKDRHVHFFTSFWSNDTSLQKKGVDIPSWCCRNCWQAFAWMGRPVLFPQHKPWSCRTP